MRNTRAIRRFGLSEPFVEPYKTAEVPWGPLGYVTFKRTYARRLSEFDDDVRRGQKSGGKHAAVLWKVCLICRNSTW